MLCIKYRIYPTKAQETLLNNTLALCREIYNSMVIERTAVYETQGKSLTRNDQNKKLTVWKQKFPELSTVHSQVLQNIAERVDLAFKAFFRRVQNGAKAGYPRFKGKGVYDSITFPQIEKGGCKLIAPRNNEGVGESAQTAGFACLQISKIGSVKCIAHRPLMGAPKTCTIRRQAGKWFACFACEYEPTPLSESNDAVGIDVGLEKFAALATAPHVPCVRAGDGSETRCGFARDRSLSDGSFVENPRFFRQDEKALAKAARKQSRTAKGSKPRRKANQVLARIHERIRNRRHNFIHQLARRLVNQYGMIAVEKLNVKNMSSCPNPKWDEATGVYLSNGARRKAGLNKSILDASWSQFRTVLLQKAASAVRKIVEVNPAYTSQDCSKCGYRAKKRLTERWHYCPICSLSLDRDTNAAFNILKAAVGTHSIVGLPA